MVRSDPWSVHRLRRDVRGQGSGSRAGLREAPEFLAAIGNIWWLTLADEFLCEAVRGQDRPREFLRLADAFEASVALTDRGTLIRRQVLLARTHLLRGSRVEAETAARRAVKLVETTDYVIDHANALLMLAEVLDARDLGDDAAAARVEAIAKLRAKGNLAAIAHLHDLAARGDATYAS